MSSLSSSSSPRPPILPTELLDQILSDKILSKRDLAKCCRVNHHFLSSSRPVLHHAVAISVQVLEDEREDTVGYSLNPLSRSLLQALADYPFLARSIQHLDLRTQYELPGTHTIDFLEIEEAFELCLARMPCIELLSLEDQHLWRRLPVRDLVFERGAQWVGLSVAGCLLDQDGDRRNWSDLPNLRKLNIRDLAKSRQVNPRIPARIEMLEIGSDIYCRTELPFEPESRLKTLRIPASDHHLSPHLVALPHLQHLRIHDLANRQRPQLTSSTLSRLTALTHLRSLSVSVSIWKRSEPARILELSTLLTFIPTSVVRLDFPNSLPVESVPPLLEIDRPSSLRFIGFRRPQQCTPSLLHHQDMMCHVENQKMQRFIQVCDAKGMTREFIREN